MRVTGMERAGDDRRSAALMWTGLVLLRMSIRAHSTRLLQVSETKSALGVRFKLSPTHRRCNDVCQQLWWTQRHSTANLNPGCTPSAHFRITNSAQPIMASRRVGADLPGRDPGIEKVPLKARSEQLRKQAGRWVYSPETSALWPMTCRPTRSRFERRQNGNRTSKRSGWHVSAASSCLNICQMQTKWTHNVGDASRSNPKLSLWLQ